MFLNKLLKNKTLVKGSMFAIFSFFNRGVSFVLLIILANFIAPAQYGELSLFNTVIMFVSYFIAMSCEGYVDISYFKNDEHGFKSDFSAILEIAITVTLFFLMILLIAGNKLGTLLNLSTPLLWIAVIVSFGQVIYRMALSYRRVREEVLKYGIMSCGYALLHFTASLLLVIVFNLDWLGRVYAHFGCVIIFAILSFVLFINHKLIQPNFSKERFKKILIWGIPLIPHLATTWLRQGCDRYIINYNYDLVEVGLFSFALNMSSLIEIIGSSFNSTNSVSIFKTLSDKTIDNKGKIDSLGKQSKEMLLIYILASILIVIGGIFLIPVIIPKYSDSIPYFGILSIYGLLRCIYFIYCNYLFYWDKNKWIMTITITSAIVHLGLSLLLTRYSLLLTAGIYVVTQIVIDFLVIFVAKRLIQNNLGVSFHLNEE